MWVAQRALDFAKSGIDYSTTVEFVPTGADTLGLEPSPEGRCEGLLCGCNDGAVIAVNISGMAHDVDATAAAAPHATHLVPDRHMKKLWQHDGCVLGTCVHESLVATSDDVGKFVLALQGQPIFNAEHDPGVVTAALQAARGAAGEKGAAKGGDESVRPTGSAACRSVLLWEGFMGWSDDAFYGSGAAGGVPEDEASAVYCFVAVDDGFVRLWRIDVASGRGSVIAVFGPPRLHDADGGVDAANIFSLALDVDPKSPVPHGRLVAGTAKGWLAWSLDELTPRGLRRPMPETVAGAAAYVAEFTEIEKAAVTRLKPKVQSVCGARAIATVAATDLATSVRAVLANWAADDDATGDERVCLGFSALKKQVEWPARCVRLVQPADSWGTCHSGPTYALCPLRFGRLLTGGSDGRACVLEWRTDVDTAPAGGGSNGPRYCVRGFCFGHTDIVKSVARVGGSAESVLTTSYDGTAKVWALVDDEGVTHARCVSSLLVEQGSQPLTQEAAVKPRGLVVGGGEEVDEQRRETARHSIACAALFAEASVLFTVSLFERVARTFLLLEVDSCEPPPDFVYNGSKTLRVRGDERDPDCPSSTAIDPFGSRAADKEAAARHPLFGGAAASGVEEVPDDEASAA